MTRHILTAGISLIATVALSSCTGLMMSTDFGFDDYGPANNWYWPTYGGIYDGPGGYFGPAWDLTPPPPRPIYPNRPGFAPSTPPSNGANRPNIIPSRPVMTTPSGGERPGNMGQAPSQSAPANNSGSSGTHRGR